MENIKRLLTLLLAVGMLLSLAACGTGKAVDNSKGQTETTAETNPTESPEEPREPSPEALLGEGKLDEAYQLLTQKPDKSAEEELLRKCLRWMPVTVTFSDTTASYTYNEAGLPVKYVTENAESDPKTEVTATYDDRGNMLTREMITYWSGQTQTSKNSYTYDDRNRVLTERSENESYWEETAYTYDEQGYLIRESYNDSYNDKHEITYTYTEQGNLETKTCDYAKSNHGDYTQTYTYDASGNKIAEDYRETGGFHRHIDYTYDENGNLLKEKMHTAVTTYTYDDRGNLLKRRYEDHRSNSSYWEEELYTYDDRENVLTWEQKYSDGDWHKYTYTYDDKGNLTTKISASSYSGQKQITQENYTYDAYGNVTVFETIAEDGKTETRTVTYKLCYNPRFAEEEYLKKLELSL